MDNENALLTTPEASAFLRLQPQTLRVWRHKGGGPAYVKIGNRVCYRRSVLEAWLDLRTRTSTSDTGGTA